jgi:ornithine cyclodeaminase/alanine dehydrogenase-like protein (mu-crystallin family)
MSVPFVSAAVIRERCDIAALVEVLRSEHRAPTPLTERVHLHPEGGDNSYLVWHAWQPGGVIATKMVTIFPTNTANGSGLPSIQGLINVFDANDGRPLAIVDGTELTYWKTAASSACAATYLAPRQPRTLALLGAGSLSPFLVHAHRAVNPSIERVLIWNRTRDKAEAVTADPLVGSGAEVVDSPDDAVAIADIVTTATGSTTPIVKGALLRPGTHVDLVGGYTPPMREADDEVIRRASCIVADYHRYTIDSCGDLCDPIANGILDRSRIADLFDLCRGERPGRQRDDEITVYKSAGGAHLDLYAAKYAMRL